MDRLSAWETAKLRRITSNCVELRRIAPNCIVLIGDCPGAANRAARWCILLATWSLSASAARRRDSDPTYARRQTHADRPTDKQTNRQTNRHVHTYTHIYIYTHADMQTYTKWLIQEAANKISTVAVNNSTVAVNNSTVAVNNSTVAVNNSTVAVNNSTVAVNNSTAAVNNSIEARKLHAIPLR